MYFIEEVILGITNEPRLYIKTADAKLNIIVPYLPNGLSDSEVNTAMRLMLDELLLDEDIENFNKHPYALIKKIYEEKNANIVTFLKGEGEPIVDPTQYEVMKANFALTKTFSDEELQSLEQYIQSEGK